MVGVIQTNMSPPMFGVTILLLLSPAWMRSRGLFTVGVLAYYGLSALVLVAAGLRSVRIHWWFLVFWPVSFAVLIFWRMTSMSAPARLTVAKS